MNHPKQTCCPCSYQANLVRECVLLLRAVKLHLEEPQSPVNIMLANEALALLGKLLESDYSNDAQPP